MTASRILVVVVVLPLWVPGGRSTEEKRWPAAVEKALTAAGPNRAELVKALEAIPAGRRRAMEFLISHMPVRDLRTLKADFLRENVELACAARQRLPWGERIPEEIFLNDVLPYAHLDEARDPWRKQLFERCLPLIKDCKTPAKAAQKLNATIFARLEVRYSTKRRKACQSPKESMEQGLASCTGLSILLASACRSVAIPARVVGTPLWANKRGNHTWVEVWDGRWHFTGAAEQDPRGLDRGWFVADAAQARKDDPRHAIYAASFRRTGLAFPLVWAPGNRDVPAENVTDRYARPKPAEDKVRLLVRVRRAGTGQRLALPVAIVDVKKSEVVQQGRSRGEEADTNDILAFELATGRDYRIRVGGADGVEKTIRTAGKEQLVDVEVPGLKPEEQQQIDKEARAYFEAGAEKQASWKFAARFDDWLDRDEEGVRQAVWKAYREASSHARLKKDFEQNQVRDKEHQSPYTVRKVGKRPRDGWPLFIAMHGGGGVPKAVNDSQWRVMQRYYRDQDSVPGYLYLALRAPNDTWNGFYADYVPPLIVQLIRQFILFGDVDPDRVYLMGYSHGGYGAFFIGPKIPDRFAAIHASAAAPTAGTISAKTLRNTRFTFMIGEKDNAYGRRKLCEAFDQEVQKLKQAGKPDYPVEMEFKKGYGHGGLPDRDKIKDLAAHTRRPTPRHVTWELTDAVVRHFFWLAVKEPGAGKGVDARINGTRIEVTTRGLEQLDLCLDRRLVPFDQPVHIRLNGKEQTVKPQASFRTLCRSLVERGDPRLAYTWRVTLKPQKR